MSRFQFTAAHTLCQYSGEACSCQTLYEQQLVNTLNTAANWSTEAEVFQDGAERVLGVFSRLQKPTFYYRNHIWEVIWVQLTTADSDEEDGLSGLPSSSPNGTSPFT